MNSSRVYKRTVELEILGEWFFIEAEVEEILNEAEKRYEFYVLKHWQLDADVHPVTRALLPSLLKGDILKAFELAIYEKIKTWGTEYNYDTGNFETF